MESQVIDSKTHMRVASTMSTASAGSNQLYIAESVELPEDTFRMSLDNFSVIGENVTIGDRNTSVDTVASSGTGTPLPATPAPDTPVPPPQSAPITETPKLTVEGENNATRKQPPSFLQLSLSKNNDFDSFVKPSPVAELMSPAKMLQFEVNYTLSLTPTVKRANIDFDFFNKKKYELEEDEDMYEDKPNNSEEEIKEESGCSPAQASQVWSQVIVQPETVRQEVGYGKLPSSSAAIFMLEFCGDSLSNPMQIFAVS